MKCREEFPNASREVLSNMYVDDCITGTDDVGVTVELQQSLLKMMELVQVSPGLPLSLNAIRIGN